MFESIISNPLFAPAAIMLLGLAVAGVVASPLFRIRTQRLDGYANAWAAARGKKGGRRG